MRRLHLTVATVISTAWLLTTTSVYALTPAKVNIGLIKPQETWKVGTVENNGEEYCAMVGTYDKKVVVAFARNPDGLGSLALDFGDALFSSGKQYDVTLTAEGTTPRAVKGRASSERSLVVQIGQDSAFYDALAKNGTLGVDMAAATLRIDLAKFSGNHGDLIECASQLSPTAKEAAPRMRTATAPIDRELQQLGKTDTKLADASAEADKIQKSIDKKTSSFDEIEAQLEAEARAEATRSRTTIASIEAQQDGVRAELEKKGVKTPLDLSAIEPASGGDVSALPVPTNAKEKRGSGRTLLAAIGSREPVDMPLSTGSAARDIEARQLGVSDAERAAEETAKALALKNEIAALEAEKNKQAQKKMASFDSRQQELTAQTKTLSVQRDEGLAKLSKAAAYDAGSKKIRAGVIAQQAKIADVSETKAAETAALTKSLASTQSDFQERILALETERTALKEQVKAIGAENDRLKQVAGRGNPGDRLEIAQLKKQLLDMETQRQGEIARAGAAQKELDAAREQIAGLRQGSQAEQSRLAELQRSLEQERQQLTKQQGAVANAEIASLGQEKEKLETMRKALEQRQGEMDQQARVLSEESQRIAREKQDVAASGPIALMPETPNTDGEKLSPGQALLSSSQRLVDSERAELNALRGRIKSLEQDLTDAREEATVAKVAVAAAPVIVPAPVIAGMTEAEKAEVAKIKDENTTLRQRLAGFLSGGDKPRVAEAVVPAPAPELTPEPVAVAEVKSAAETEQKSVEPKIEEKPAAEKVAQQKPQQEKLPSSVSPAMAALGLASTGALTAAELNASEPAAGEPDVAAAPVVPGNDKRMPAVPAPKVMAEAVPEPAVVVVTKEIKTTKTEEVTPAIAEAKTETVVDTKVAANPVPETPVVAAAAPTEAELEITRMAPITHVVPRGPVVAAQKEEQEDKGIFSIFGRAMGYNAASEHAAAEARRPQAAAVVAPAAPKPAVIRVTRAEPKPAPQPPAVPIAAPADSGLSDADVNRAASFLDNIMSFHRPGGGGDVMPAAPAPKVEVASAADVSSVGQLNAIETAAGAPSRMVAPAAAVQQPEPPALRRPAYLAQPAQAVAAVEKPRTEAVALSTLLSQAGLSNVRYTGGSQDTLRQWTTGSLNGMYERQGSTDNFSRQIEDYLSRYREDCPGNLDVKLGDAQTGPGGTTRVADITCNMPGNAYATSIAFLDAQGAFLTVLHAGQPGDAGQVNRVGVSLARGLRNANSVVLPPVTTAAAPAAARVLPVSMTAPAIAAPVERPRFRIEIEAPAAVPPDAVYDLPTTIIE